MNKILLCGRFAFGTSDNGGQPVKSRELFLALEEKFGKGNVDYTDTLGWKRNPFKLIGQFFIKAKKSDCIIMLPAQNGVKVFSRLLIFAKKHYRKKIFYSVIGGWLPKILETNGALKKILKEFNGIWVETSSMKADMDAMGFDNVYVVPNFKSLKSADVPEYEDFSEQFRETMRFCTFSRVSKEKGIEDAVEAIKAANKHFGGEPKICLDIYGQINDDYKERFDKLQSGFPEYISYKGIVPPGESVDVLKNYYALLFPTFYNGEGFPGTLIDALASCLPSIVSDWHFNTEIIADGKTGYAFNTKSVNQLMNCIISSVENPDIIYNMKINCKKEYKKYDKEAVVDAIESLIAKG